MRVAVIGDTHVPSRAPGFPEWVERTVRAADHTIHVGDFDSPEAHFETRVLADGALTAVAGNDDPRGLGLPAVATVELGGVRFVLTHGEDLGRGAGYRRALAALAADHGAAVAAGGHTHRPIDATVDGVRVLNPGSATGAAPAEAATMLALDVADGAVTVDRHDGAARH